MNRWRENEPLADHCSWHIGGPADHFFEPASEAELREALREAQERALPAIVVGNGTVVARTGGQISII